MGQRYETTVEQVSRNIDGTVYYGYKPSTVTTDPLPSEIVWKLTANDPDSGYVNIEMTVPNTGKKQGLNGMWAICPLCGLSYAQSTMSKINGQWYCNKNGCAQEVRLR